MHPNRVAAAGLTLFVLPVLALAASPPNTQEPVQPKVDQAFFDARIAPVLKDACLDCHGGSTVMSHTDLRTEAALKSSGSKGSVLAVSVGGFPARYRRLPSVDRVRVRAQDAQDRLRERHPRRGFAH